MSFDADVCRPVRKHLGRPVRLPSTTGTWNLERIRGTPVLRLELDASDLGHNLQTNRAAVPWFLVCFAYWYGRIHDVEPRVDITIHGTAPTGVSPRRHYHRAWVALEALEHALGDRLDLRGAPAQRWPEHPCLNAPQFERATTSDTSSGAEHQVEVALTRDTSHAQSFSRMFSPITEFRRQLPLGLFEGEVSQKTLWTPGGSAQADLWSTSPDGRTFHLFELKVGENTQVGVLPELLAYLWILHRTRIGGPDGQRIEGGGPGVEAARRAERFHGWIVAPRVHPLVKTGEATPLEWLAKGLSPAGIELGIVFFDDGGRKEHFASWVGDGSWRSD